MKIQGRPPLSRKERADAIILVGDPVIIMGDSKMPQARRPGVDHAIG